MPWSLLTDFQAYDDGKCYEVNYIAHVHLRLKEKNREYSRAQVDTSGRVPGNSIQ